MMNRNLDSAVRATVFSLRGQVLDPVADLDVDGLLALRREVPLIGRGREAAEVDDMPGVGEGVYLVAQEVEDGGLTLDVDRIVVQLRDAVDLGLGAQGRVQEQRRPDACP